MNFLSNISKKTKFIITIITCVVVIAFLTIYKVLQSYNNDEFNPFDQSNYVATVDTDDKSTANDPLNENESELAFNVQGLMGGCGTRLTFDKDNGQLVYNPKGKTIEKSNLEYRTVLLESYDESTCELVLQVNKGDRTTGRLIGTYIDGNYEGVFKNVNGNSSPFSFK